MKKQKRLLITGGGTFGHIAPALTLKRHFERAGYKIQYICAKRDRKFPFYKAEKSVKTLSLSGLPRSGKLSQLGFFVKLAKATIVALFHFIAFWPQAVLATGGFVTFPYLFWARFFRKKIFICEQNSFPGLVNRLFSPKAVQVFTSMPDQSGKLKGNMVMCGNPVEIRRYEKAEAAKILNINYDPGKKYLGVLGGSQGAEAINQWILREQRELSGQGYQIIMSVGQKSYQELLPKVSETALTLFPFIENMGAFYSLCDLFISRSGASSIAEYFYFMKPVIFVPYPHASDNHQYFNARFALEYLDGSLIHESELAKRDLLEVLSLLESSQNRKENPFTDPVGIIFNRIDGVVP